MKMVYQTETCSIINFNKIVFGQNICKCMYVHIYIYIYIYNHKHT
jgi:hypothetical protein